MIVVYRTNNLEKVCENIDTATRKYGKKMAAKIHERIYQLKDHVYHRLPLNFFHPSPLTPNPSPF